MVVPSGETVNILANAPHQFHNRCPHTGSLALHLFPFGVPSEFLPFTTVARPSVYAGFRSPLESGTKLGACLYCWLTDFATNNKEDRPMAWVLKLEEVQDGRVVWSTKIMTLDRPARVDRL